MTLNFAPYITALYGAAEEPLPNLPCPVVPLSVLARGENRNCVELPQLTSHVAFEYLRQRGGMPWNSPVRASKPHPAATDEALAGFLWANLAGGAIFVRTDDPVSRRRFSVAHELGHFVLHWPRELEKAQCSGQRDEPEFVDSLEPQSEESEPGAVKAISPSDDPAFAQREREADAFAAELLMPPRLVGQMAERLGPRRDSDVIARLAVELLVSRAAMRWRLRTLGLLREE